MLNVVRHAGRLVEIRFSGSPTVADVLRFNEACRACIGTTTTETKQRAILCTDLRATMLFRPDVGDHLLDLMRGENRHVERNAFLGNGSALFSLQLERLVKQASGPGRRRVFAEPAALYGWIDGVLNEPERARLRAFLSDPGVVRRSSSRTDVA